MTPSTAVNRFRTTSAAVVAAAVALGLSASAPATASTASTSALAGRTGVTTGRDLSSLVQGIVAAGAPGAAVRVNEGRAVRTAAAGSADLRRGRPMRPELNYRAGSLAKPMVATVVLQLVGEGKLALSDTVERWLPGVLNYGDRVTVRHLLTMTSGVPEYLRGQDCVVVVTDHSAYDWPWVVSHAPLVVDTRNATRRVAGHRERIVLA